MGSSLAKDRYPQFSLPSLPYLFRMSSMRCPYVFSSLSLLSITPSIHLPISSLSLPYLLIPYGGAAVKGGHLLPRIVLSCSHFPDIFPRSSITWPYFISSLHNILFFLFFFLTLPFIFLLSSQSSTPCPCFISPVSSVFIILCLPYLMSSLPHVFLISSLPLPYTWCALCVRWYRRGWEASPANDRFLFLI